MVKIIMVDGRIFKTVFAILVIFTLIFSALNVYSATIKRKSICRVNINNNKTSIKINQNGSFLTIVTPKNNSIYVRNFRCHLISFLFGEKISKLISSLYDFPVDAIVIGKTLIVRVNVNCPVGVTCKKVVFGKWGYPVYEDREEPYECTFDVNQTNIYYIDIIAYCTDHRVYESISVFVSPNLYTLFKDAGEFFHSQ